MRRAEHALRRFPLYLGNAVAHMGHAAAACCALQAPLSVSSAALSTSPLPPRKPRSKAPRFSTSTPPDVQAALFNLLRGRLCSPTHPLPARNVYNELTNRSRVVEEFHFAKTNRRIAHQRVALSFLRRYNVLLHGLLFFCDNTQTWNTTAEFQRLALFGESILTTEVRGRLLKLFPDIPFPVLVRASESIVGEEGLSTAFDRFDMKAIVGAKPKTPMQRENLTSQQKCHMLCAIIGEMYWFVARTRPTDRTHNNALFPPSDVLILHVLCSHLLECIPSELIFGVLEPLVAALKRVWVNEPMSLPSQLRLTPRTIGALSLNTVCLPNPLATTATTTTAAVSQNSALPQAKQTEAQSVRRPLTATPDTKYVKSFMRPMWNHRNFDSPRYQVLEADGLMETCVLSSSKVRAGNDAGSGCGDEASRIARAMELAKLAVQK